MTQTAELTGESQIPPAEQAFYNALDTLAVDLPEVEANRADIEAGARQLIEEFDIDPSLFEDEQKVFFFSAIAQRNAQLEANRDTLNGGQYFTEKDFIASATVLLALDKSGVYPQVAESVTAVHETSDEQKAATYDRFTNHEATGELRKSIETGGLMDGVQKHMGITAENEDPYTLRVLNIANRTTLVGMRPPIDYTSARPGTQEWKDKLEAEAGYKLYEADLMGNEAEMRAEHFSGNRQGYNDVKQFNIDLKLITGTAPTTLLELGGNDDPLAFYKSFANVAGMQRTLEYALLPPREYISDQRTMQKDVNDYLGGFDGFVRNLYNDVANNPATHKMMDERIRKYAEHVRTLPEDGEYVLQGREVRHGLYFLTDKIRQEIKNMPPLEGAA